MVQRCYLFSALHSHMSLANETWHLTMKAEGRWEKEGDKERRDTLILETRS